MRQKKCKQPRDERFERLLATITGLGFRANESRAVLKRIRSGSEGLQWGGPLEAIVRRAVQLLS